MPHVKAENYLTIQRGGGDLTTTKLLQEASCLSTHDLVSDMQENNIQDSGTKLNSNIVIFFYHFKWADFCNPAK